MTTHLTPREHLEPVEGRTRRKWELQRIHWLITLDVLLDNTRHVSKHAKTESRQCKPNS